VFENWEYMLKITLSKEQPVKGGKKERKKKGQSHQWSPNQPKSISKWILCFPFHGIVKKKVVHNLKRKKIFVFKYGWMHDFVI